MDDPASDDDLFRESPPGKRRLATEGEGHALLSWSAGSPGSTQGQRAAPPPTTSTQVKRDALWNSMVEEADEEKERWLKRRAVLRGTVSPPAGLVAPPGGTATASTSGGPSPGHWPALNTAATQRV